MYVKFANLPVDDIDRAIAFYTGKLRLTLTTDAPYGEGGRWVELDMPEGNTSVLVEQGNPDRDRSRPVLVFITPDVNAAYERLCGLGVDFHTPPTIAPWKPGVTFALLKDSEGNLVLLSDG